MKAIQKITKEFEFNTYIISVLVIFFLQMNHGLPTTINLGDNYTKTNKDLIYEFFLFYARKFQHKSHIISARFGRWQQRKWNPRHKIFDGEQQKYYILLSNRVQCEAILKPNFRSLRLRDVIEQHPRNWDLNCAMFVQDLVRLHTNITAELREADVIAFQNSCAKLVNKFNGIGNKSDKRNTPKKDPAPRPVKILPDHTSSPINEKIPPINELAPTTNEVKQINQPSLVRTRTIY